MDSSSVIMRLEAAADAAVAEARVRTWKRYAEAKMRTVEAQLAAEEVKLENEAAIAKARYHAMEMMMDKLKTESDYLVNEDTGELCRNSNMEKICPSDQVGHSRKMKNPAQCQSAEKWPGQVSESRVLQTHQCESAQKMRKRKNSETEIREVTKSDIKKREEVDIDIENAGNDLNLEQLKIEVGNRITEMKMEIQSRKRIAEIRRVELQGAISRRKRDAENSRRKRSGDNSRKNSEEENSRGNMEKAQKSSNLREETQNRNMEITRSKLEVEENEQSCRWDSSLITEIPVDEMPSLENLEEVAEIGPQNYGHPFFNDDSSGAVTGTEEKGTKNDDLYLKNSEKKNHEETKIEKKTEQENEESKVENEAETKVERENQENLKENMKGQTDEKRLENRPYAYESRYSAKRKCPPRKLIKLKSMSREERPKSTVMKRFLFNCLRPPETPRRGQGEGLCQQTSLRHLCIAR